MRRMCVKKRNEMKWNETLSGKSNAFIILCWTVILHNDKKEKKRKKIEHTKMSQNREAFFLSKILLRISRDEIFANANEMPFETGEK